MTVPSTMRRFELAVASWAVSRNASMGATFDAFRAGNQAATYAEVGNFPSSTAALEQPALQQPDEFFGGQITTSVFKEASERMPVSYVSPIDNEVAAPFITELANVQSQGKDPQQAWNDALTAAKQVWERSK